MSQFGSTPFVNSRLLPRFQNKTVKIVGKVDSLDGESATFDVSGPVKVTLYDANFQEGGYYEVVGKVESDLSINAHQAIEFEKPVDLDQMNKFIVLLHRHKEMFY